MKTMHPRALAAATLLFTLLLTLAQAALAQSTWTDVERIVAIGDIHGDYDQYIEALERSGLIDDRLRWSGGETHLVQMGDVPDRGPDTMKVIEHLQKLKRQAKRAGGHVHTLIGNHEAMMLHGDLRYINPGEYAAFVTRRSKMFQERYIREVQAWMEESQPEADRSFERLAVEYPLGYVEHRVAWAPDGDLGSWVLRNPTAIKINDTIFVHGGLSPHGELKTLDEINAEVRTALAMGERVEEGLITINDDGPLWYRGLARAPAETELEPLMKLLEFHGANRIVVGHTPTSGQIETRLDGRVLLIDVGSSAYYGANDGNLLIEDGEFFELSGTGRRALEVD